MKAVIVALLALACSKAKSEPTPSTGSAASAPVAEKPTAVGSDDSAADPAKGTSGGASKGITVKHQVAEMTGDYDLAFARVDNGKITIAFVRGCPKLTCDPGPWEAEQVAHTCPKAYVATAKIPSADAGKYTVDVSFAGPMNKVSTATLEAVGITLTSVDVNAKIVGSVSQKTSESSATGSFTAKICPRT